MKFLFRRFDLELAHNWMVATSQATGGKKISPVVLVELRDGDGVVGLGESSPASRYGETVQTSLDYLQLVKAEQLSFDDITGSMAYLDALAPGCCSAKGALNIALLDGAARKARQPLHDFLGLSFVDGAHLTSITIGLDTPAVMERKTAEAAAFPILKLKVGAPNDVANLAAVRAAGSGKTLRLDANEAWATKEQALQHIEALAPDPHIEFIEQPMPAQSAISDFAWLKARSPIPIVGDESYHTANDATACADCFHGVNIKLCKTGGVSRGLEALQAARRQGLKTMIGCMVESSILTSAGAHLASLADWLDLDGMLLITNDPFRGVTTKRGVMSFTAAPTPYGLRVQPR